MQSRRPGIASVRKFRDLFKCASGVYVINPHIAHSPTLFMGVWPVRTFGDIQYDGIFFSARNIRIIPIRRQNRIRARNRNARAGAPNQTRQIRWMAPWNGARAKGITIATHVKEPAMPLETSSPDETQTPGNNLEIGGDSGVDIPDNSGDPEVSPPSGIEIPGAKVVINLPTPMFQVVGGQIYKLLLETAASQVRMPDGVSVENARQHS